MKLRLKGSPNLEKLIRATLQILAPPPDLTVSQWADQNRILSSESSAEPGKWDTNRAPYQREIMDSFTDPTVHSIILKCSAQVGKTEILHNAVGYFVDQDPCPILVLQPTVDMAESWSKERLSPMFRDTPCLRKKLSKEKSKDSNNTILKKKFPGGQLTVVGTNSPSGLASRPVRLIFADEVDRYPLSAGKEGDPVSLAKKRTTTFFNRKIFLDSTPTIQGISRIDAEYEESDKRRYHLPCKDCGHYQHLRWAQVRWENNDSSTARYVCEACGVLWQDVDIKRQLKHGKWIAEKPFKGIAGFHLNELYSPWSTMSAMVDAFLVAKKSPETLKTWVNTSLGETWEEKGETVEHEALYKRREHYNEILPADVLVLTAGVDVQDNRLECEVVGWGEGFESWSVGYRVFYGDPGRADVWKDLDDYLSSTFEHETGVTLRIACACVDSGGHFTNQVYKFCKARQVRRIYAVKGRSQPGGPIASKPSTKNKGKVLLFTVGTDTAKELIYSRLKIDEPGPGYCHFSVHINDEEYFKQLTAEEVVLRYHHGFPVRVWVKKASARNEALDMRVYATAAVEILKPKFDKVAKRLAVEALEVNQADDEDINDVEPRSKSNRGVVRRKGRGFVNRWKDY